MTGPEMPGRPMAPPGRGAALPDLRSLVPPGGPPALPPLTPGLTRDQRKVREQHRRDRAKFARAHRADPLPPGVWVVRANGRYSALRVLGPDRIEVWRGRDDASQQFTVAGMKRGWWRGSRLKFLGPDGAKQVIRTVDPGSVGLAAVGDPEGDGSNLGGDDPLTAIVALLALIVIVFIAPWLIARAVRRRRVRNEIYRAVRPHA